MYDDKTTDTVTVTNRFLNKSTGQLESNFYDVLEELYLRGSFDIDKLNDRIDRYKD